MMLSLQSDPGQQQQLQIQYQHQQVQQRKHQQLLQQVVDYNNDNNYNGGRVDRRSDPAFALHNEPGALPSSANIKQEFLSREGILDWFNCD